MLEEPYCYVVFPEDTKTECVNRYIRSRTNEVNDFLKSYFLVLELFENRGKIIKITGNGMVFLLKHYEFLIRRYNHPHIDVLIRNLIRKMALLVTDTKQDNTLIVSVGEYKIIEEFIDINECIVRCEFKVIKY